MPEIQSHRSIEENPSNSVQNFRDWDNDWFSWSGQVPVLAWTRETVLSSMCMGSRSLHCVLCKFDIEGVDMKRHGMRRFPTCIYSNLKIPAFSLKSMLPNYSDDSINPLINHLFCFGFIYEDRKINKFTP